MGLPKIAFVLQSWVGIRGTWLWILTLTISRNISLSLPPSFSLFVSLPPIPFSLIHTNIRTCTYTATHSFTHTRVPLGLVKYSTLSLCFFICKIRTTPTSQEVNETMRKSALRGSDGVHGNVWKEKSRLWLSLGVWWWLEEVEGAPRCQFVPLGAGYMAKSFVKVHWAVQLCGLCWVTSYVQSKVSKMIRQRNFHYAYLISDFHYARVVNLRILSWLKKEIVIDFIKSMPGETQNNKNFSHNSSVFY